MVAAGLVYMTVTAPQQAFTVMLDGAGNAVELALSLFAVYAVWLSVLEIMDKTGISKAVNRLFSPLWRRIFRGEDEKSLEYISLNFSANLLGMGSAATPMGIKAMESMSRGREKASDNMILFLVFNATSIQLIPATVIGMRAASGSAEAADIILPSLLATLISTLTGVLLAKLCAKICAKINGRGGKKLPLERS